MSFPYLFNKTVAIPDALNKYLRDNLTFQSLYTSLSTDVENGTVTVYMSEELTMLQLDELTTLVTNYVDPEIFLSLNHCETFALHSHFTADFDSLLVDGKYIIQTIIFQNPGNTEDLVLDGMKTVVEYTCPDPAAFYASTGGATLGDVTLQIYDVSRNITIASQVISLNEISDRWNTLGAAEQTTRDTVWRSHMFTGLMNMICNYDCVWQVRGLVSDPATFDYRINGLQYLFYDVQRS